MYGCGEQEAGVASGSGWNLWVWLLGVVVRRYIYFLILLIPTPLVSVLFCSSIPTFCSLKKNVFHSCINSSVIYLVISNKLGLACINFNVLKETYIIYMTSHTHSTKFINV